MMVWRCKSSPRQRNWALERNGELVARVIFDTNVRKWLWYFPGRSIEVKEAATLRKAQAAVCHAIAVNN